MKLFVFEGRKRGSWYWRLVARNGRTVAISGEAFSSARKAFDSFERMARAIDGQRWPDFARVQQKRVRS